MEAKNDIITRCKSVFERFSDLNFLSSNHDYFEKMISFLSDKEYEYVLQEPFVVEWVDKCVTDASEDFKKVNSKVMAFMLNVSSFLLKNEWIIIKLRERQLVDRIIPLIEENKHQFDAATKVGVIRFFSAICQYCSGLGYVRCKKVWSILLYYSTEEHLMHVVREARKLLYEILYKYSVKARDDQVVLEIITQILTPLASNIYANTTENITVMVDDTEQLYRFTNTFELMSYILQETLISDEKTNIAFLCQEHFDLTLILWKFTDATRIKYFTEKILTTLTSHFYALLVYEKCHNGRIDAENFNDFGVNIYNTMKYTIARGEHIVFLKLCELNLMLWKKLSNRVPIEVRIEEEFVKFENQLILFHMMPVLYSIKSKESRKEECFDSYLTKLFEISCEQTQRICYQFRDSIIDDPNAKKIVSGLATKAINGTIMMQNTLKREQAVLVFQAMSYVLIDFVSYANSNHNILYPSGCNNDCNGLELILEEPNLLNAILIGTQSLIHRYKITWKESIETICLINVLAAILENQSLTPRLAVQNLKLVQLAIEHFLAPNMALLVDNLEGSGLVCLGPIIAKRCEHEAWEVRDSAVELISSIANISRLKFPAFQKFLMDNNICEIVYNIILSDRSYYVRASALKCLTEMITINLIWENYLSKQNLIEELFIIAYNEKESIVRKEAVILLSNIYEHRKIPDQKLDWLFSTMIYCVEDESHWEVREMALYFWSVEIMKQLSYQGMIDGTFPTVTFSKEHKKIVKLTESEIQLRITKVLNILSARGCLGILLHCLNVDCDGEVIKTAAHMVKKMQTVLKSYDTESLFKMLNSNDQQCSKLESICLQVEADSTVIEAPVNSSSELNYVDAEKIMEDIINLEDINLLAYCEKILDANEKDTLKKKIDRNYYSKYAHISTKEFFNIIKEINLDELIRTNQNQLAISDNFSTLLNDILQFDESNDLISLDCY